MSVTLDRFGRFYAPLALAQLALAFLPILGDVHDGGHTRSYGTIFDMVGRSGVGPAVIGLVLLAVHIALLVVATFRASSPGIPTAIVACGALIALMLVTKPGTDHPTPELTSSGTVGLALAVCTVVIGGSHAILARRVRAAGQQRPDSPLPSPPLSPN